MQNYIKYVFINGWIFSVPCLISFFFFSNPYDPGSGLPGALGRGQATASALGNFFKFWAYASTIIGAIVAGNTSPGGTL